MRLTDEVFPVSDALTVPLDCDSDCDSVRVKELDRLKDREGVSGGVTVTVWVGEPVGWVLDGVNVGDP